MLVSTQEQHNWVVLPCVPSTHIFASSASSGMFAEKDYCDEELLNLKFPARTWPCLRERTKRWCKKGDDGEVWIEGILSHNIEEQMDTVAVPSASHRIMSPSYFGRRHKMFEIGEAAKPMNEHGHAAA
jgi:hypothetical protein